MQRSLLPEAKASQLGQSNPDLRLAMAPVGSAPWAEFCRKQLWAALDHEQRGLFEFDSGLARFWEHSAWSVLTDADGAPFPTFRAFALAKRPHGLGCAKERLDLLLKAINKSLAERVADAPKLADNGGTREGAGRPMTTIPVESIQPEADVYIQPDVVRLNKEPETKPSVSYGNSADYLAARLKRDRPDLCERLAAGEFPSVRAAAVAAGIVKPPDPVKQARSWLARVPGERVLDLIVAVAEELDDATLESLWKRLARVRRARGGAE